MKKFTAKYHRDFEVEIESESTEAAAAIARQIVGQFPVDTVKLLSVYAADYKAPPDAPTPVLPSRGKPSGGVTPGTPVVKQEILVDQIAEAA